MSTNTVMQTTHHPGVIPYRRCDANGHLRPESVIAVELATWRNMNAPVHPRDYMNPYYTAMHAVVDKIASWLGYGIIQGALKPVPAELGGGWLVSAAGVLRGPRGYIAHIDEFGWVLRVEPFPGLRWPDPETPIEEVMGRLVDDPCWPGLGLVQDDVQG